MDDAKVYTELKHAGQPSASVELEFEYRQKARLRAITTQGDEVWVKLPRGSVMRAGDRLFNAAGDCLMVGAAAERVSQVTNDNAKLLTRVAYHLGNRHVWVEVGDGYVRYLHDPVLDDMVRQLGADVAIINAGFEPEAGAYGSHGHDH